MDNCIVLGIFYGTRRRLSFRLRFGELPPSLQLRRDKSPRQAGAAGCAWRIEYEGALYRVLSRDKEGRNIVDDDDDRRLFLDALSEMAERFCQSARVSQADKLDRDLLNKNNKLQFN